MDTTTPRVSPLRQRMIEDMRMRKLSAKTPMVAPLGAYDAILFIDTITPTAAFQTQ